MKAVFFGGGDFSISNLGQISVWERRIRGDRMRNFVT
jgi:hypothetical protein